MKEKKKKRRPKWATKEASKIGKSIKEKINKHKCHDDCCKPKQTTLYTCFD